MNDLAVIVVSYNSADWLGPCLRTLYERLGNLDADVVVVDSGSSDDTAEAVRGAAPSARVIRCDNHGFAHANNRGLMTCDARHVLFLNPDTEFVDGSLEELVGLLDDRPEIGIASVRQILGDGTLFPTMRRFPSAIRSLGEALGSERIGGGAWLGERVLGEHLYDRETPCDWATGAFMIARREALESAGFLDERFFLGSEETDLWFRIKAAGWETLHLPSVTIVHHAGKAGFDPRTEAQYTFARLQYARKHMSPPHRLLFRLALLLRSGLRSVLGGRCPQPTARRRAHRRSMRVLAGREKAPLEAPPRHAVRTRSESPPRAVEQRSLNG